MRQFKDTAALTDTTSPRNVAEEESLLQPEDLKNGPMLGPTRDCKRSQQ